METVSVSKDLKEVPGGMEAKELETKKQNEKEARKKEAPFSKTV